MKKRHRIIIQAMRDLGGKASLEEISEKTGFNVNGLSQSMNILERYVNIEYLGGKCKKQVYKIKESTFQSPKGMANHEDYHKQ